MRELSKQDIIKFFQSHIADTEERRKLSCHVVSTCEGGADTCDKEHVSEEFCRSVSDITGFKSSLPLFPLVKPYVQISSLKRPEQPEQWCQSSFEFNENDQMCTLNDQLGKFVTELVPRLDQLSRKKKKRSKIKS